MLLLYYMQCGIGWASNFRVLGNDYHVDSRTTCLFTLATIRSFAHFMTNVKLMNQISHQPLARVRLAVGRPYFFYIFFSGHSQVSKAWIIPFSTKKKIDYLRFKLQAPILWLLCGNSWLQTRNKKPVDQLARTRPIKTSTNVSVIQIWYDEELSIWLDRLNAKGPL